MTFYSCDVPSVGACIEYWANDGWTIETSSANCQALTDNTGALTFFEFEGCDSSNAVGNCLMPANETNLYRTTVYYGPTYQPFSGSVESDCTGNNGSYTAQ